MANDHIELHPFHGGICPSTEKAASTSKPIQFPPLADRLVLPLLQHSGEVGRLVVAPGDAVKKGQVLVAPEHPMSVAVHAPTSGTVIAIEPYPVPHPSGIEDSCILLDPDGLDHSETGQGIEDFLEASPAALLEQIRWAGIAGLGGAGFPTDLKLSATGIHTLIINGAECEPYISADDMLMRERAADVLQGILILLKLTQAKICLVGIEDDKPQAILAMQQALEQSQVKDAHKLQAQIQVVDIPTRYPSGGEKQLIRVLTGQEVPSGQLPSSLGIVCQNVGTAYAVYRAVAKGEPLISRITTLAGGALKTPMNVEALLGTPVGHLLNYAGLNTSELDQLIMGGPLMGVPIHSLDTPISKISNCVLAASAGELTQPEQAQSCIRCGYCADVCPAQLLPQQLYWFTRAQEWQKAQNHHLFDCIECGACAYVCPSQIPLVQYYRFGKGEIRQAQQASLKSDRARERFESRQQRLEREQAERIAKRKARALASSDTIAQLKDKTLTSEASSEVSNEASPAAANPNNVQQPPSVKRIPVSEATHYRGVGAIGEVEVASVQPVTVLQQSAQWLALEKKLRMTQDRVEQAQERLSMARSQGLDTEQALERALQKQLDKQAELEQQRSALLAKAPSTD
jgi:electron transport complex protein RnfC